jgi:hypothetical protein
LLLLRLAGGRTGCTDAPVRAFLFKDV